MRDVSITRQEVEALLVARLADVLGIDPSRIRPEARLAADLHADSLDLIEVIEAVERGLRARGVDARLPEERLLALRTVGDAVEQLHAAFGAGARR